MNTAQKPDLQTDSYELRSPLGEGAMALVWKALDRETGKEVAIKIVHEAAVEQRDHKAEKTLQRFVQEVEIMMNIDHPNVARMLACGSYEQGDPPLVIPYMVMEFVEGSSLRHRMLAERIPPLPYTVEVIRGICAGLEAAHAHDVIHRDLKPENVVVGDDPRACKLIDFGMAKVTSPGAPALTTDNGIFGTPQYMAPERARGQTLTPASDVYAVGLIAFELLAGKRPFDDKTPYKVMMRQVFDPTPPLEDVAPALRAVVEQAMEKEPEKRPDAATFARKFQEAAGVE